MDSLYFTRAEKATRSESVQPSSRARAIIEFVEGDLSRTPVIYPEGGSDELDSAICKAIQQRWSDR
jgi:hypothetical protein